MDIAFVLVTLLTFIHIAMSQENKGLFRRRNIRLKVDEPFHEYSTYNYPNVPRCVPLFPSPKDDLPWNDTMRHEAPWPPPGAQIAFRWIHPFHQKYTRAFPDQKRIETHRLIKKNEYSSHLYETQYVWVIIISTGIFIGMFITPFFIIPLMWFGGTVTSPFIFLFIRIITHRWNLVVLRFVLVQMAKIVRARDVIVHPAGHTFYPEFKLMRLVHKSGDPELPEEFYDWDKKFRVKHGKFKFYASELKEMYLAKHPRPDYIDEYGRYIEPPEVTDLKLRLEQLEELKRQEALENEARTAYYDVPDYRKLAMRLGIPYEQDKKRFQYLHKEKKPPKNFTVLKPIIDRYPPGSYKKPQSKSMFKSNKVPKDFIRGPSPSAKEKEKDPVVREARKIMKRPTGTGDSDFENPTKWSPFLKNPFVLLEASDTETEEVDTEEEILEALAADRSGTKPQVIRRNSSLVSIEDDTALIKKYHHRKIPKDFYIVNIPD